MDGEREVRVVLRSGSGAERRAGSPSCLPPTTTPAKTGSIVPYQSDALNIALKIDGPGLLLP